MIIDIHILIPYVYIYIHSFVSIWFKIIIYSYTCLLWNSMFYFLIPLLTNQCWRESRRLRPRPLVLRRCVLTPERICLSRGDLPFAMNREDANCSEYIGNTTINHTLNNVYMFHAPTVHTHTHPYICIHIYIVYSYIIR